MKLSRLAKSLATGVNVKRRAKGLLPRPVGSLDQLHIHIEPYYAYTSVCLCLAYCLNFSYR